MLRAGTLQNNQKSQTITTDDTTTLLTAIDTTNISTTQNLVIDIPVVTDTNTTAPDGTTPIVTSTSTTPTPTA